MVTRPFLQRNTQMVKKAEKYYRSVQIGLLLTDQGLHFVVLSLVPYSTQPGNKLVVLLYCVVVYGMLNNLVTILTQQFTFDFENLILATSVLVVVVAHKYLQNDVLQIFEVEIIAIKKTISIIFARNRFVRPN